MEELGFREDQILERPIFIVGFPRSGTTWVYDILKAHPHTAGVLESWLFTPNAGLAALFMEHHWPARQTGLGQLISEDELASEVRQFAQNIFRRVLKPVHQILVEKSPSHLSAMPIIRRVFPQARFIHIIRDGRDVSVSVLNAARSWAPQWKKSSFGSSLLACARSWERVLREGRLFGCSLGEDYLEIRYEELERNSYEAIQTLYRFCGLAFDDSLLKESIRKTDFKLNHRPDSKGFHRLGRSGDWKENFNPLDSILFDIAAGALLKELGYKAGR